MNRGAGAWFDVQGSRVAYEGFCTVRIDQVRMPDGTLRDREVCEHVDAVAMVPVTAEGEVLLVRQYRHPHGAYLLEIPAGLLDVPEEEVSAAAGRELVEETHHEAGTLEHLVTFHNSAGWTTERTHVYLATDLQPTRPPQDFEPDAEEADMEVERLPFRETVELARAGALSDAKTVIGLLLAEGRLAGG